MCTPSGVGNPRRSVSSRSSEISSSTRLQLSHGEPVAAEGARPVEAPAADMQLPLCGEPVELDRPEGNDAAGADLRPRA